MTLTRRPTASCSASATRCRSQVTVTDPEDGTIDCTRVTVNYVLGHDSHGHRSPRKTAAPASIQTTVDGEHDAAANIFGVFDAEYTDRSAA